MVMVMTDARAGESSRKGADPRAPHWFAFNRINERPNDWTFTVLDWDNDPGTEGVKDEGEAEVRAGPDHRFVITTWLQPRDRTHDRYYSVAYETENQDGVPEPLSIHIGRSESGATNSLGHARQSIDSHDAFAHILVRDHNDGPRETFRFPTEWMAEQAADLQTRLKIDRDDRDYRISVHPIGEWEDQLELEQSLEDADV